MLIDTGSRFYHYHEIIFKITTMNFCNRFLKTQCPSPDMSICETGNAHHLLCQVWHTRWWALSFFAFFCFFFCGGGGGGWGLYCCHCFVLLCIFVELHQACLSTCVLLFYYNYGILIWGLLLSRQLWGVQSSDGYILITSVENFEISHKKTYVETVTFDFYISFLNSSSWELT